MNNGESDLVDCFYMMAATRLDTISTISGHEAVSHRADHTLKCNIQFATNRNWKFPMMRASYTVVFTDL